MISKITLKSQVDTNNIIISVGGNNQTKAIHIKMTVSTACQKKVDKINRKGIFLPCIFTLLFAKTYALQNSHAKYAHIDANTIFGTCINMVSNCIWLFQKGALGSFNAVTNAIDSKILAINQAHITLRAFLYPYTSVNASEIINTTGKVSIHAGKEYPKKVNIFVFKILVISNSPTHNPLNSVKYL